MKNIFKTTILIAAAGILLSGCEPLEQRSKSTYEDNTVFSNYTLARYAVNAIYESGMSPENDEDIEKEVPD